MKLEIEINDELLQDVIITALEGGSNYWYVIKGFGEHYTDKEDGITTTEHIANQIVTNPMYKHAIYYTETGELLGIITQSKFKNALLKNYHILNNVINGSFDVDDADIIFQNAVMGEVQFG